MPTRLLKQIRTMSRASWILAQAVRELRWRIRYICTSLAATIRLYRKYRSPSKVLSWRMVRGILSPMSINGKAQMASIWMDSFIHTALKRIRSRQTTKGSILRQQVRVLPYRLSSRRASASRIPPAEASGYPLVFRLRRATASFTKASANRLLRVLLYPRVHLSPRARASLSPRARA